MRLFIELGMSIECRFVMDYRESGNFDHLLWIKHANLVHAAASYPVQLIHHAGLSVSFIYHPDFKAFSGLISIFTHLVGLIIAWLADTSIMKLVDSPAQNDDTIKSLPPLAISCTILSPYLHHLTTSILSK